MVGLDGRGWAIGVAAAFDHVWVQRSLGEELGVFDMPGLVPKHVDENVADDPLAMEAIRASAHFRYDPQATYIILTPPTSIATGQPVYCGYHTQTNSLDGLGNPYRLQYAFIPFLNMNWPGLGNLLLAAVISQDLYVAMGSFVLGGVMLILGNLLADILLALTDPRIKFA